MDSDRSIDRRQFDDVIRRASELAAAESDQGEGALAESELIRIAGEVGLSERHVRRALAEVRSGASPREDDGGLLARVFGVSQVRAGRVVPGTPRVLSGQLDAFLVGGRLLQAVRRSERLMQYRPAVDWASQVARAASATSRRYHVAAARSVEIRLEAVDGEQTLVEIEVDPGSREDAVGAAVAGLVAGVVVGGVSGLIVASALPLVLAICAGTLVTGGIGAGATVWARSAHRRRLRDVHAEVEGILDSLEAGETLEPPPAAWRKWVQRHFHGMAKDVLITKDD